ncbi:MAG: PQQ-binding-like beta-propeller repeat protein [Pirellulaceae bacterium]|nr:PQQ-binding-like beta-propeller repeat protein [Pirellulaceae bacterium]
MACCAPTFGQQFRIWQVVEFAEDVQVAEADNVARSQLETIDRFVDAGQWDEAVEALRRLMDTDGDKLLALTGRSGSDRKEGRFVRFVSLRDYCQMRLAALHGHADEALDLYRARVDSLADNWLREATSTGDARQFRRIAERFFMSSSGDDALYQLGERELARGHFTLAREAWERISPELRITAQLGQETNLAPGLPLWLAYRGQAVEEGDQSLDSPLLLGSPESAWLAYPDTDLDLADVRARLVLVSILEGSQTRAAIELEQFRRLHGTVEGTLAGRRGPYADLLRELLEQSRDWAPIPPPDGWPTFAGAPTRGKNSPGGVDLAMRPIWTVDLPHQQADAQWIDDVTRPAEERDALLSYHPLVVDGKVLLCTGERIEDVHAYDLQTGRPLWPEALVADPSPPAPAGGASPLAVPPQGQDLALRPGPQQRQGVARFTMTTAGGRLFVKLGTQATSLVPNERFDPPRPGHLVALDLKTEKRRMFEIHLEPASWGAGWAFEGAPLIDGENLYVSLRRRENLRSQSHVACFVMRRNRAELRWRTWVVTAESLAQGDLDEYTHHLLTLDQGILYTNTNLGAVAALDARDGRIRWLTRYPRAPLTSGDVDRSGRYLLRDLNPCLVARDTVFAAPADCDRLFALDAATGMLLWQTAPAQAEDAVHLLGVGGDHLLASGDRLYWIDRHTGRVQARFPERIEADLRGYGRGVLVGDDVLWPTRDRIFVLAQDGPRSVRQPIELAPIGMTGGNLVPAGDILLVAGADRLAAYNPWGRQITKAE